jgi:hypothetical protein
MRANPTVGPAQYVPYWRIAPLTTYLELSRNLLIPSRPLSWSIRKPCCCQIVCSVSCWRGTERSCSTGLLPCEETLFCAGTGTLCLLKKFCTEQAVRFTRRATEIGWGPSSSVTTAWARSANFGVQHVATTTAYLPTRGEAVPRACRGTKCVNTPLRVLKSSPQTSLTVSSQTTSGFFSVSNKVLNLSNEKAFPNNMCRMDVNRMSITSVAKCADRGHRVFWAVAWETAYRED